MKPFQFQFSDLAEQDFARLPFILQKRIWDKLHFFETSSRPLHFAKKLHGSNDAYRFRIGDYRVLFDTVKDKIIILKVGHRKDIYG